MSSPEYTIKLYTNRSSEFNAVERAVYYAVRLLAKMDESCAPGTPIVAPDAIVWAVERLKPSLVRPLREAWQTEELVGLLRHYGSLRQIAEKLRIEEYLSYCEECGVSADGGGYLTIEDVLYAIAKGIWKCDDMATSDSISLVLHTLHDRLKDDTTDRHPEQTLYAPSRFDVPRLGDSEFGASDGLDPEMLPTLSTALLHTRQQLLALDIGYDPDLWCNIYTSVIGDWLEEDYPDVAAEIVTTGVVSTYFENIQMYVNQMQEVERLWISLGHPIRTLLRSVDDEAEALQVIEQFVREDGTDDADAAAWARRVWDMVKRRDAAARSHPVSSVTRCDDWNFEIEKIRMALRTGSTCFVINADALPQGIRSLTDEKYVLAVRLPERWLEAEDVLGAPAELDRFYWTNKRTEDADLTMSINRSFWCSDAYLWPQLFRFRRSVPVLYVFNETCMFARYQFSHFSDLCAVSSKPRKHLPSFEISDGAQQDRYSAERYMTVLPDGSQTEPAILTNLDDRSTPSAGKSLQEAYRSENPDANESFIERFIRGQFS
ncbi:MAG: hypothetical protein WBR17_17890 [Paraburkholderia sp.]|uniref:hypothetical protein n=1 Tax=Paraburkholderia sp. TaxID=1926495 RepID=UPI003C6B74B9